MCLGAALATLACLAALGAVGTSGAGTPPEGVPDCHADSSASAPWQLSAWAETFVVPDGEDLFNPTFYARHGKLQLEARYNYEDRNTASLWAGRRFRFGGDVRFDVVPMAAVVFGETNGAAPGLEATIAYKRVDWYSESEHVIDFHARE